MYSPLYNRLCGWLFFALGCLGLFQSQFGNYIRLSQLENCLNIAIGLLGMMSARVRVRYAVVMALWLGLILFFWGLWGLAWPNVPIGTAEPLENAIRIVAGAWGMYVSVQDVLEWRRH